MSQQLSAHITNSNLFESFQSAFRACHFTETALTKVEMTFCSLWFWFHLGAFITGYSYSYSFQSVNSDSGPHLSSTFGQMLFYASVFNSSGSKALPFWCSEPRGDFNLALWRKLFFSGWQNIQYPLYTNPETAIHLSVKVQYHWTRQDAGSNWHPFKKHQLLPTSYYGISNWIQVLFSVLLEIIAL